MLARAIGRQGIGINARRPANPAEKREQNCPMAGKGLAGRRRPRGSRLLTVKAARLIAAADAVVSNHLIGEGIIDLACPGKRAASTPARKRPSTPCPGCHQPPG